MRTQTIPSRGSGRLSELMLGISNAAIECIKNRVKQTKTLLLQTHQVLFCRRASSYIYDIL